MVVVEVEVIIVENYLSSPGILQTQVSNMFPSYISLTAEFIIFFKSLQKRMS
jgi:hypothetical protein